MTYNNPQHNTNKYSCTPFPILKEGDTSGGIVTYLDLVDLGSISGFGVNLTEIGGTQRWDNTIITSWQTLFDAINEHLTIFNARLQELEQSANPDAITIISKSNNQLEANVNNVTWSSSSPQIIVNPTIGQTTTYSLASSATSYGSFTLTANRELIEEGESITITAQWIGKTTTYDAIITATKSGMTPATKSVQLPKEAICPTSVTLDNGKTIALNSSGRGTLTYTPSVGNYTVKTQGNETPGSCSFTVNESTPKTITITSKSGNQLEANVDNVNWSSDNSYIDVNPKTGKTTTYSLNITPYGSFELTASESSIEEGESITITAQWTGHSRKYSATITASKSGWISTRKEVQLYIEETCPAYVDLDNGARITLDSNGRGTYTYAPTVGNYTIRTQGNETPGSCSFTVAASQPTTTYYWYVGTTLPTAANLLSIATGSATSKPDWSTPYSIAATNNTGESSYLYYCFPADWNVIVLDSDRSTEVALASEGTITVNNITYNIQRTGRKISKGTSKDYYAIFNNIDAITITSKSNNQLEANVDNVNWSSDSSYIDVNPTTGQSTTYSLSSSATPYGSFTLTAYPESMEEGESVTITAQWNFYAITCDATITATKSGMRSATKQVTLSKDATCPAYVDLDNGERITLDTSNGRGTCTYIPVGIGNYTVTTQGNETPGSCSFTVVEATPVVEPVDADLIVYYNIQDTSNPTTICNNGSSFKAMEIDGVVHPIVVSSYKFDTTGEHVIKYELNSSNIGSKAFDNCSSLINVDILDGVTSIGDYAFAGCNNITSIDIPDSVTSIGADAFYACSSLTSIDIPDSITSISNWTFAGCSGLTSIDIPSGVRSICDYAFYGCSGLTSIDIPNNVTSVGDHAFDYCINLTSIVIPDSVTSIGAGAFQDCRGLTSCTIGSGVTSIGASAFSSCSRITSIDIPDGVTSIGDGAFWSCSGLTSINIPNNVTSIGYQTFTGCSSLTSIDIPDSVTSIGASAFSGCTGLISITIGDSVTSISGWAFADCTGLTSIVSNTMTAPTISNTTFENVKTGGTLTVSYYSSDYDDTWLSTSTYYLGYYDWNIEYYDEPDTITIISKPGNQLEANVNNVSWSSNSSYIDVSPKTGQTTTYALTSSATSYGSFALTASESLIEEGESITITTQWYNNNTPYSATITATKSGMTSATKQVTLSKDATCPAYVDLDNGARITLDSNGRGTYTYTPTVGSYTITTQGNETSDSCSFTVVAAIHVNADLIAYYNVQNISSPTAICFNNGDNFKSMEIDGNVSKYITTQGEITYQFNSVGSHTIKYELNGSNIDEYAFSAYTSLTSVDILDSVTSIGDRAFSNCSSLTSIDIPDSVTSIGPGAFQGSGLTSITIPDSVTSIYSYTFNTCTSLTSVDIPDSVTSIGNNAFYQCSGLTSIDIPSSVTSIGYSAFQKCSNLESITSNAMTAPTIKSDTFQNVKIGGTLTVSYYSSGYDVWLSTDNYYLGKYDWNREYYDAPKTITITSKSDNQLEANVDNVSWSSDSSYINVYPETGQTTTYSLSDSATSYGSFVLNVDNKLIEEGESITITAQWYEYTTPYSATITASSPGMTSATKFVQLSKAATCPSYVYLDNGARITLDSNGRGTYTYTPTAGSYTIKTQGNETQGSCSFTVNEVTPVAITITSKSNNQLEANVDNVNWSSDNSYIDVYPETGQTTTYSLSSSATSYGSFTLTTNKSSIQEGESIAITAQWHKNTTPYSATITATKSGMESANKQVTLSKAATCPASVTLDNGQTITLNISSGSGTRTYTPAVGNYTIRTQGNETQGSCSFTVVAAVNVDADLIAYYNVQNISSPTPICINNGSSFKSMEIDGVDSVNITTQGEVKYQFNTTGAHTIKYELNGSSIGNGAFSGTIGSLTSIDILDSVTSIGDGAFAGRSTLTSIDIPNSVTSIGSSAFAGCGGLTSVDIPNSVTSIGGSAFAGCSGLTSVDIPNSVTTIGGNAFSCSNLTSITSHAMTAPKITSNTFQGVKTGGTLTVPYGCDNFSYYKWLSSDSYYLGYYDWHIEYYGVPNVKPINEDIVAYYNIQNTSSPTTICVNNGNKFKAMEIDGVVQPNVVESYQFNTTGQHTIKYELNDSNIANGAFSACTSLTSCTIADSVTSIGMGAFAGCKSLTSIDIPDSVTSIGTNAFSGCSSLTSIVCNAMTAPKITSSTFASIATDGTLTRPAGSTGYDVWLGEGNYYLGKYGWHAKLM